MNTRATNPAEAKGMACPVCGHAFFPDIPQLLYQGLIQCPNCRLELRVNRQESKDALVHLEKLHEAHQQVQAAAKPTF